MDPRYQGPWAGHAWPGVPPAGAVGGSFMEVGAGSSAPVAPATGAGHGNPIPQQNMQGEFLAPYDPEYYSDDGADSYHTDSGDDEGGVDWHNYASYLKITEERLWDEGLRAYERERGRRLVYFCQFCQTKKIPKDGQRQGLLDHVRAEAEKTSNLRKRANHEALKNILEFAQ